MLKNGPSTSDKKPTLCWWRGKWKGLNDVCAVISYFHYLMNSLSPNSTPCPPKWISLKMEDQNVFWAAATSAPAISCLLTGFSGQLSSLPHPCSTLCITAAARDCVLMMQPEYAERMGGSYLAQGYQRTFQSPFQDDCMGYLLVSEFNWKYQFLPISDCTHQVEVEPGEGRVKGRERPQQSVML